MPENQLLRVESVDIADPKLKAQVLSNLQEYRDKNQKLKNANTRKAYESDFRDYLNFCHDRSLTALSDDFRVTLESMRAFFDHLMIRKCTSKDELGELEQYSSEQVRALTLKRATISRKITAIRYFIGISELDDPYTKSKLFHSYVIDSLNLHKPSAQGQATPMTLEVIDELNTLVPADNLYNIRNLLLINLAFDTLMRASNLIALQVCEIDKEKCSVFIPKSKTDKLGEGSYAYISAKTIELLSMWLDKSGVTSGSLFRKLNPISHVVQDDALGYQGMYYVFKSFGLLLKKDGISCHSTRVGAVISQIERDVPMTLIIQSGKWSSDRMALRYGEQTSVAKGGMAKVR